MLGASPLQPDALLGDPVPFPPEPAPVLPPSLVYGPIGQTPALLPYDAWGAIRIPTTASLPFVPVATNLWVSPASVPASDPALAVILDFVATHLVTDRNALAAWQAIGGVNPVPVTRIFPHDPEAVVFSTSHLPALYLWRESSKQQWDADDWQRDHSTLKGLWVYPLAQQNNQRARQPFTNALAKCMGAGIERGRTPSWVQPGDTDPDASRLGSLFWLFAGFDEFDLTDWKVSRLTVRAADGTGSDTYPAIEFTFSMTELLVPGLGRFSPDLGMVDVIRNAEGTVMVAGDLGATVPV